MTELARPALSFDRVISPALEQAIAPDGELHWLLQHLTEANPRLDVHLRASQTQEQSWVSAYYGLTTILNLHRSSNGFWLDAHPTHRIAGFDDVWSVPQPAASLTLARSAVCTYIDTLLTSGGVNARHTEREGRGADAPRTGERRLLRHHAARGRGLVPIRNRAVGARRPVPESDRAVDVGRIIT